jgi:hypothetical protein
VGLSFHWEAFGIEWMVRKKMIDFDFGEALNGCMPQVADTWRRDAPGSAGPCLGLGSTGRLARAARHMGLQNQASESANPYV